MTTTLAFSLIAALLMLGVIADSLWGRRRKRRPQARVESWAGHELYGPGPKGVGSEKQHYEAAEHRAGE
jgi:hypothetical protein